MYSQLLRVPFKPPLLQTSLPPQSLCNLPSLTRTLSPPIRSSSDGQSTDGQSSDDTDRRSPRFTAPQVTPPEVGEVRFRRRSKRQRIEMEERRLGTKDVPKTVMAAQTQKPKTWEEMNLSEKALELYVGEKGMLYWLNKFAYASIYITIGAWILFRFVGPALNLYQLDAAPLTPDAIFKK